MWITTKQLDILMTYFSDPCYSQMFFAKQTDLKERFTKEASKLRAFPIVWVITFHIVLMKAKSFWFQLHFNGFCWHQEWRPVVKVFVIWDIQSWVLVCCIFFFFNTFFFFFFSFCHRPPSPLILSYFHILILHLETVWDRDFCCLIV